MKYRNFTFKSLEENFGVRFKTKRLFPQKLAHIEPTNLLREQIARAEHINTRVEKPRSEFLIAPVMGELKILFEDRIELFSGEDLSADPKLGLNGEVDFILSKEPHSPIVKAPLLAVVEAKKADIEISQPQCAAQMIGAMLFNKTEQKPIETIFGCITTGQDWQFMQLEGNTIYIDRRLYFLSNLPELLGVFKHIITNY